MVAYVCVFGGISKRPYYPFSKLSLTMFMSSLLVLALALKNA